jgi:hypothetical protein
MEMHAVNSLIAGLEILKRYKPDLEVVPCSRVYRTLETQEVEFGEIDPADRARLLELGWETNGVFLWHK